jgi:hypothetical protein
MRDSSGHYHSCFGGVQPPPVRFLGGDSSQSLLKPRYTRSRPYSSTGPCVAGNTKPAALSRSRRYGQSTSLRAAWRSSAH